MNNVTLVSTSAVSLGIRSISSYLRKNRYSTNLIFLDQPDTKFYGDNTLKDLETICNKSKIIGISGIKATRDKTLQLIDSLNEQNKIIVSGGYDSTLSPQHYCSADYICKGDGEFVILDLINEIQKGNLPKEKILKIKNVTDINELPQEDYDNSNQFTINDKGSIILLNGLLEYKNPRGDTKNSLFYITSRGCPYSCTYCQESAYQRVLGMKMPIRRKSVKKVIDELNNLTNIFPQTKKIYFLDSDFFVKPHSWIKEFSIRYSNEIKKPFWIFGNPNSMSNEKLKNLKYAGLDEIEIGIQSGSKRTNEDIYKRKFTKNKIISTMEHLHNLNIKIWVDIIYDNPWEKEEDLKETINLIKELPKSFKLGTFGLSFFEGTQLYEKAKKEGIDTERKDAYKNLHKIDAILQHTLNKEIRNLGLKS